ncbi:hypothetical protein BC833DRAFT_595422 [Globomyces pollinis-pini]|nr:hypothetical protein BC833DRAFT_595422 [Globomyces pollinis-pini]
MSGNDTHISTTPSSRTLDFPMVSVDAIISSDSTKIKTIVADFYCGGSLRMLFAQIRPTQSGRLLATVQGYSNLVRSSQPCIKGLLAAYDVAIVWGEESLVDDDNRLSSVTIENTPAELTPSIKILEKHFDEIYIGGSITTEDIMEIFKDELAKWTIATPGFGVPNGWIPPVKDKHIYLKYDEDRYVLEVSSIQCMETLKKAVSEKIRVPHPIKCLYLRKDNYIIVVTDVKDLQEGYLYYALTVNDELPKKETFSHSMEEFFEKLKKEEDLEDEDILTIKECFGREGIKFKQLMYSGDLAITDENLKEYGIAQGGLRTAILAVIKRNIQ